MDTNATAELPLAAREDVNITLASYDRGHTYIIEVEYPEGTRVQVIEDLGQFGWATDGMAGLPPLNGIATLHLHKRGNALFGGWNDQDKTDNLRMVETVLNAGGYKVIKENRSKEM